MAMSGMDASLSPGMLLIFNVIWSFVKVGVMWRWLLMQPAMGLGHAQNGGGLPPFKGGESRTEMGCPPPSGCC